MPRAVSTAIQAFKGLVTDKGKRVAIGVHLGNARRKDVICPQGLRKLGVGLQALRVLVQVLVTAELNGIQKDTHHRYFAILSTGLDKRPVSIVKRPHGGHQADDLILLDKGFQGFT